MESRVWREKIMLIYHVSHLEDGDLAKDMLEEQVSNNWPGLAREPCVSALKWCINIFSTSFHYALLLTFKVYPMFNSFFNGNFGGC